MADDSLSIYDEIEIEDMTFDPNIQIFHYPCPCGDRFEIAIDDLRDGEEIAVCPSCSLMIRVIFDEVCLILLSGWGGGGFGKANVVVFFDRRISLRVIIRMLRERSRFRREWFLCFMGVDIFPILMRNEKEPTKQPTELRQHSRCYCCSYPNAVPRYARVEGEEE